MEYSYLKVDKRGAIVILEINRPEALNALNHKLLTELEACYKELATDDSNRIIILTGTGKAFVAGADIAVMKEYDEAKAYEFSNFGQSVFNQIEESPIVTIAAINGFALGGGLELALACDFRIASNKAKLGLPEVSLGIIPGFGGTQRLSRITGKGIASEMIFTGDMYSVEDCYHYGIINKIVEPEKLLDVSIEYANKIISRGKQAIRQAKAVIRTGIDLSLAEGLFKEKAGFAKLFSGAESKEGLSAFLEKRKPNF